MTPAWARIREVFLAALERPVAERTAFVRSICADDEAMRAEVESLLAAEAASGALSHVDYGAAVAALVPDVDRAEFVPRVGMRIGRYQLTRELATGGMGTVFEAEQTEPRRTVAVKTMRGGLTKAARARFQYEAQALARLQHEHIAQLYEAGIHEAPGSRDGEITACPYFAMEYVTDARPLTTYATEHALPMLERIRLFIAVVDAVHYGHQRGVIHRDLKPGNVLVDGRGRPKIIDYGIARFTDADTERSIRTLAGEVVGTLLYMSPEQLRGDRDAIDVRSDVYALGVVLHELLAGVPPFALRESTVVDAMRILTTTEPKPPSAFDPRIPRDLDWIVQRALERDPDHRYASALAFSADLARFLAHEPVEAGPPSTRIRIQKFVRRNRVAVTALSAIFVSLTIGIAVALRARADEIRAREEAEAARDDARSEAARANETVAFVRSIFETARADTGSPDTRVKDLLAAAARRIDRELGNQPLVEASVRAMMGDCYLTIDADDDAAAQFERAVELRRRFLGDDHLDTIRLRMGLGNVRSRQGRREDAEAEYRAAAEGLLTHAPPTDVDAVLAVSGHATTLEQLGRLDDAEREYRRALDLASQRCNDTEQHAMIESMYANVLVLLGRADDALEASRSALERIRRSGSTNMDIRLRVSLMAAARIARKDPTVGAAELGRIVEESTQAFGKNHSTTIQALTHRGLAVLALGRGDEAIALLKDAEARVREADGDTSWTTAMTRRELAKVLERTGDYEEEESVLTTAIADATRGLGDLDPDVIALRLAYARFLAARVRVGEAETAFRALITACVESQGPASPTTFAAVYELADLLGAANRFDEVVAVLGTQADALEAGGVEATLELDARLGTAYVRSGRYAEAIEPLERAERAYAPEVGADHAGYASITELLGIARREIGDLDGSEQALQRCLESRRAAVKSGAADEESIRTTEAELAKTRARRGK